MFYMLFVPIRFTVGVNSPDENRLFHHRTLFSSDGIGALNTACATCVQVDICPMQRIYLYLPIRRGTLFQTGFELSFRDPLDRMETSMCLEANKYCLHLQRTDVSLGKNIWISYHCSFITLLVGLHSICPIMAVRLGILLQYDNSF